MSLSNVIESLEELKGEYHYLSRHFKDVEGEYDIVPFLSDTWYDCVHDQTSFKDPLGGWYSILSLISEDEQEVQEAKKVLEENPDLLQVLEQTVARLSDEPLEKVLELLKKSQKVLDDVGEIIHQNGLMRLNITVDTFLELEKVYYESSRCW